MCIVTFSSAPHTPHSALYRTPADNLKALGGDKVQMIDAQTKDLTKNISDSFNGTPLWRYFVLFALLCIIAEICLLRFWKVKN